MKPEISEFSYGFALTNEIVSWSDLRAAPVFPSLIEEGREGGGYDVKLQLPAAPLFLQFKRSEYMTRRSAREYRNVRDQGGRLSVPFHRFPITEAPTSNQHDMLLGLDVAPNYVFYAAPRFHTLDEINHAWTTNGVASSSVFIAPSQIGSLDDDPHTIAFDGAQIWRCSEPARVEGLDSEQLLAKLLGAIQEDIRPLKEKLPELVEELRQAEVRGRARIEERRRAADALALEARRARRRDGPEEVLSEDKTFGSLMRSVGEAVPPRPRSPPRRRPALEVPRELFPLREAADIAARVFDCQLVIVQPTDLG